MKRCIITILCFFLLNFCIFSQEIQISYKGDLNYTLKERTDLRRYDNGKYTGLVSLEVTSYIVTTGYENGYLYEGNFFIQEDTKRAENLVFSDLRDSIPSQFKITDDGNFIMIEDKGFPTFRSFPSFPNQKIKIGDTWTAKAHRAVDPLNKGVITKIPLWIQYQYVKEEVYNNEPVYLITAQWATRYGIGSGTSYIDNDGDKELQKATGSHKANIYVSKNTGNALLIKDYTDESFTYSDGKTVQFKGTISLFTEYPPAINKEKLIPVLIRVTELTDDETQKLEGISDSEKIKKIITENNKNPAENKNHIAVDVIPGGIRLSIQNLQFKPNSPELLSDEKVRLNQIAEILNTVPDSKLLVEGHTARIGNEEGELELSLARSKTVAKALNERGVDINRFICKGYGGSRPVSDNSTEGGRAMNRRVEITILE